MPANTVANGNYADESGARRDTNTGLLATNQRTPEVEFLAGIVQSVVARLYIVACIFKVNVRNNYCKCRMCL